ncbi:MAG: hypothetical protein ACLS4Z_07095 [Christensenellaceae bacterium]
MEDKVLVGTQSGETADGQRGKCFIKLNRKSGAGKLLTTGRAGFEPVYRFFGLGIRSGRRTAFRRPCSRLRGNSAVCGLDPFSKVCKAVPLRR